MKKGVPLASDALIGLDEEGLPEIINYLNNSAKNYYLNELAKNPEVYDDWYSKLKAREWETHYNNRLALKSFEKNLSKEQGKIQGPYLLSKNQE